MFKAKLALGPMSSEIIEAAFKFSNFYRKQLMLIASKNQIDYSVGYVNNWTTKQYMDFIREMKEKYKNSDIKICRDHCGPGFNGKYELEDTYNTIKADIGNGFDLIHIDFCMHKGGKEEKLIESKKAIQYCLKLNPNISLEIGTDENEGINFSMANLEDLKKEINFFKDFCNPEFYVIQTGSLIKEINQVGNFNKEFVSNVSKILNANNIKLKEHNADYLSVQDIKQRGGIVDAMNIAPQLGVIQTALVLNKCLMYGINFDDFIEETYKKEKWKKWMYKNTPENKFLCAIISGHYNFASDKYKNIIAKIEEKEDIHESIINVIMEVIDHYENNR